MYAIVEIAGQQFKVRKDQQLYVHNLGGNAGDQVRFDNVMLIDNGGKVNVGAPAIDGAQVTAKVLQHLKGDKIVVFKKKRRKGYKVKNGHRQHFTEILIEEIKENGATPGDDKVARKAEPEKEEVTAEVSEEKTTTEVETTETSDDGTANANKEG